MVFIFFIILFKDEGIKQKCEHLIVHPALPESNHNVQTANIP